MKKNIKTLFNVITLFLAFIFPLFPEEENESPLKIYLQTAGAYYPASECKTDGSNFAPVTGAFSGIECSTTLFADYKIETPLGRHWLLKDANVLVSGGIQLTPISLLPQISVGFQPFPFFVIKAGAMLGLGWNFMGFEGLCEFDEEKREYKALSTLSHPYYNFWAESMLMFDTGAIIPGDWTHVVMLAAFRTYYSGVAGIGRHDVFEWQGSKNYVQGFQYEFRGIVGYQPPLVLNLAGVMCKTEGHFDGADYGNFNSNFDGDFCTVSLSPMFQFKFGEKDELLFMFDFSSRRQFNLEHDKAEEELYLKSTGREWYFKRFVISWTHIFR